MMDFIIGHMLRLYAKVTQIIFFSFIFILAQHIGGAVSTHGKTPQTWSKKYQISKLAENPSKSGKRLKPKAIPLFLRDVGLIKVVLKFSFWPFFWPLLPKVPIFTCPKMALRVPEQKFGDHFYKPNIPQK